MLDEDIIKLFFDRSEEALKELENKYGRMCLQTSYNIVGNHSDAEECVNDAYLGAWNSIPPAKPDPLLTYVLKIVRNVSVNCYHKNHAKKRNGNYDVAMEELAEILADSENVESIAETNELVRNIESFLDKQSTPDRVMFVRRYWFCDDYEQIAKRLGISQKNVSVKLTRLRKRLKDYLEERGIFL